MKRYVFENNFKNKLSWLEKIFTHMDKKKDAFSDVPVCNTALAELIHIDLFAVGLGLTEETCLSGRL